MNFTNLTRTDLRAADLTGVAYLNSSLSGKATVDKWTKWPSGVARPH
jgi:hypothetical protein